MKLSNHLLSMTVILLFLGLLIFSIGCQQQMKQGQSEQEMLAIVEKYADMWNTGDTDIITEIYPPSWILHNINGDTITVVADSLKKSVNRNRTFSPDLNWATVQTTIKDNMIIWQHRKTGTIRSTGKKTDVPGVLIFKVVDGKISEVWHYEDHATLLKQLGYKFVPPSKGNAD